MWTEEVGQKPDFLVDVINVLPQTCALSNMFLFKASQHLLKGLLLRIWLLKMFDFLPGMYYYVYEYVAHDLKGIIESKLVKLSPDDISGIMTQLLNAVDYCHSHNLVHRNIKSSNILINYR